MRIGPPARFAHEAWLEAGKVEHRAQAEQQALAIRLAADASPPPRGAEQAEDLRAAAPHVLPDLRACLGGGVTLQLAPPGWASTNWSPPTYRRTCS